MKRFKTMASLAFSATILFAACEKDKVENPKPVEQELITTVQLTLTSLGDVKTYTYKVENGFTSGTPGAIQADTIKMQANKTYYAELKILNEKASPAQDLTGEIQSESNTHLFLYNSDPSSGPGSVYFTNGSKDGSNQNFNLTGNLNSNGAGNGTVRLYLLHAPTNKNGINTEETGGETDMAASFPVVIQ